jgi:transposase-like protein
MSATLWERLRYRRAKAYVEFACGMAFVCPYCREQTANTFVGIMDDLKRYVCTECGRTYLGPW